MDNYGKQSVNFGQTSNKDKKALVRMEESGRFEQTKKIAAFFNSILPV